MHVVHCVCSAVAMLPCRHFMRLLTYCTCPRDVDITMLLNSTWAVWKRVICLHTAQTAWPSKSQRHSTCHMERTFEPEVSMPTHTYETTDHTLGHNWRPVGAHTQPSLCRSFLQLLPQGSGSLHCCSSITRLVSNAVLWFYPDHIDASKNTVAGGGRVSITAEICLWSA
jgi:hypothetical protein